VLIQAAPVVAITPAAAMLLSCRRPERLTLARKHYSVWRWLPSVLLP